jgi:RNA polymerase sigma-70 factor (ECF subfamily)
MFHATSFPRIGSGSPAPVVKPPQDELLPLARAAATGQREALTTLVMSIGGPVLQTVRRVLGTEHPDVEDVTQDSIIAVVGAIRGFRAECTVTHFAHRVAVLTAMAARRRSNTRKRYTQTDVAIDDIAEERATTLAEVMAGRRRELVRQLLDQLPEPIAEALALHFVLGYTVDEIASASSVPSETVWSRLRLGKQALRRRLGNDRRLADLLGEE